MARCRASGESVMRHLQPRADLDQPLTSDKAPIWIYLSGTATLPRLTSPFIAIRRLFLALPLALALALAYALALAFTFALAPFFSLAVLGFSGRMQTQGA